MKLKAAFSWTFVSVVLRYALRLLSNLTLVRLLTPQDFGMSAIVIAVVTGLEAITDVGTRPALIRSHRNDDAWLDTAWTLGLVRGVGIGFAIAIAAIPLAAFFEQPALAPMIAAIGSMSVLIGLTSITSVLVVRDLEVKTLAIVEILAALAGYVVMLGWAWVAPSAWALLSGAIVSTGAFTVISHFYFGRRPIKLHWDSSVVAELVGFGKWVFLSALLGFVLFQGDRFSVAKLVSIPAAGIYTIAITWALSLQAIFMLFLSRLYLPVAAQLWRFHGGRNSTLLSLRRNILTAMIIPYALAAGCGIPMITYIYPHEYGGAGLIMAILVIGSWFSTLEFLYNDQLMVAGQPTWRFYAQLTSIVVMAGALAVLSGNYSVEAIAVVFSAGAIIRSGILLYATDREFLRDTLPDLATTAAFMVLAMMIAWVSKTLSLHYSPLVSLIVCIGTVGPIAGIIARNSLRTIFQLANLPAAAEPVSRSHEYEEVGRLADRPQG